MAPYRGRNTYFKFRFRVRPPPPPYSAFQTRVDVFKLIWLLKFKKFFGESDVEMSKEWKRKSTFTPQTQEPSIVVFERLVLKDIEQLESTQAKVKRNLNREQLALLENLSSDESIVIKPADKEGGIVILNKEDDLFEAHRQLADESIYTKVQKDPTQVAQNLIRITVQEAFAMEYISKDLSDFLIPDLLPFAQNLQARFFP